MEDYKAKKLSQASTSKSEEKPKAKHLITLRHQHGDNVIPPKLVAIRNRHY